MKNTIKSVAASALFYWASSVFISHCWAALPVQKIQLANGALVYWVESPAIAMLDVQIDVDGGSRRDPVGKAGLASMAAAQLEKGVVQRGNQSALDENALGEAWADLGAQFNASASQDGLSFTLRTLTEPDLLAKAVALAARQIGQPAFNDAIWQRDRQKVVAAIKESDTRPSTVARHDATCVA